MPTTDSILTDLSDHKEPAHYAKTMIHGQPGTGKTTLAGTIAEVGKTLYLYFPGEEGVNSLNGVPYEDNIVRQKITDLQVLDRIYWAFEAGNHDFVAVVLESMSSLQVMWKKVTAGQPLDVPFAPGQERPETDYDYWGGIRDGFTDFFTFWYGLANGDRDHPIHVIMTCQTAAIADAESMTKMQPDLHKGPLAGAITRPDQIIYTYNDRDPADATKQKPFARIKPSSRVTAKTRCAPDLAERLPEVLGTRERPNLPKYLRASGVAGLGSAE